MPTFQELITQIQTYAEPLVYVTEDGNPGAGDVNSFSSPRSATSMDEASFKRAMGMPPFTALTVLDFNDFFEPINENDETGQWEQEYNYLVENVSDLTVFKTQGIQFQMWACGLFDGRVVGITSHGVQT